jgi:hypothetical protein
MPLPPPREAKYCMAIFAVSVFPAPLSPLHTIMANILKFDQFYGESNNILIPI